MARLSLVWFLLFRCLLYTCTLFQLLASPLQYQITCGPAFVVLGRVMGPLLKCPVLFGISDVANVAALTVGWTTALHLKGEFRYQIPDTRYFFFRPWDGGRSSAPGPDNRICGTPHFGQIIEMTKGQSGSSFDTLKISSGFVSSLTRLGSTNFW